MNGFPAPTARVAGAAGVLAGVGLVVEGAFWTGSGWTPETFADPSGAVAFVVDNGVMIQGAVFAGMLNLVFTAVFVAGLASRLRTVPTAAAATLYLGLIGVTAHALVPAALWFAMPSFADLASAAPAVAPAAWGGFAAFIAGAGGAGSLFLGLSVLATGWAGVAGGVLPKVLGWVAVLAGAASVLTVLTVGTPVAAIGEASYFPSLLLVIVFRLWGGLELWRGTDRSEVRAEVSARAA